MSKGSLYLIPVPLAPEAASLSFSHYSSSLINQLKTYIVENEKTARKFLKEAGLVTPQSALVLHDYGKHQRSGDISSFFSELMKGEDVGLMSEAGCPGIADPGADIVAEAHRRKIRVIPLPGPNSMIQALMSSGLNGQSFAFHGYLPIDKADRSRRLKELENLSGKYHQTQLFMETPFRNNALLDDLLKTLLPATRLCIAAQINSQEEYIHTHTIAEWRKITVDLHKKPVVFLLLK